MNESTEKTIEKRNPLLVPGSIVLAGVLVAAALLYDGGAVAPAANLAPDVTAGFSYVGLASELKLDTNTFATCLNSRKYRDEVQKDLQAGQAAGVEGTPGTFINGKFISGAVPYTVFKQAIDAALVSKTSAVGPGIDDDVVLGDPDAPVTIITFGDYQCPYCEQLFQTGEQDMRRDYVETGKAKMVYRDFLIPGHKAAIPAAEAAQCAGDQGKYWPYHDQLFERQAELTNTFK